MDAEVTFTLVVLNNYTMIRVNDHYKTSEKLGTHASKHFMFTSEMGFFLLFLKYVQRYIPSFTEIGFCDMINLHSGLRLIPKYL